MELANPIVTAGAGWGWLVAVHSYLLAFGEDEMTEVMSSSVLRHTRVEHGVR